MAARRPRSAEEFFNEADAETVATIKDLIETRVRPAVANDGGDITFRGFKEGIVYLDMKGSCAGCPSSTATLKHGIQNLLKHFVPDVVEVQQTAVADLSRDCRHRHRRHCGLSCRAGYWRGKSWLRWL